MGTVSLLKQEPARAVRSLEELFAIAYAMEEEAATRYAEIAGKMRSEGNADLAAIFERLADDERGHRDSVTQWSEKERGRAPDPALVLWELPTTFDDEGAGTTDPHLVTAYRSLSMAVRNEERAFAFWTYVAAHAGSPDIRQAAEAMAHEELEHVATLRRERRRAYHAERSQGSPGTVGTGDVAALERRLADQLEQLARRAGQTDANRLRGLAEEARRNAEELMRRPDVDALALRLPRDAPQDATILSELLVDHYLAAAERLTDESAVARAQVLAGRAISRLAWLRADLPALE
jgi:rubrerythrin